MIETARTWALLRSLRRNVRHGAGDLRRLQDELLVRAVRHAEENVPFYGSFWRESDFDPASVRGVGDLERIPLLPADVAKRAVRSGALASRDVAEADAGLLSTTGSSGEPLTIRKGPVEERLWRAQGLRIWQEHGYRLREKKAQFDANAGAPHPLQRLGISRTAWIPSREPVESQRRRFVEARAHWLIATPTVLRRLARSLEGTGSAVLRGVFCQGELVDAETRGLCRDVFGLDPVSVYALTEVGYVAWQCERREGHHVNADTHLVEIRRGGRLAAPGELGRVVVTDLRGRAVPFLRYETGDLAIASDTPCPCGRGLPVLSVEGRADGALRTQEGGVVTGRVACERLAGVLSLDGGRLTQDAPGRIRVELWASADEDALRARLHELLGETALSIARVDPPQALGEKTHAIRSRIPPALD